MNDRDLQNAYAESLSRRSAAGRKECVSPEALHALVMRERPETDRLRALDHVMQCADCKREFDLLHAVERAEPRPRRFLVPGLAVAAVAVIAVVGGVLWVGPDGTGEPVFRGADSASGLVAPVGTVDISPALLEWRAVDDAVSYSFEITTPDGSLVASGTTSDSIFAITAETELRAGVTYTWRVEAVRSGGIRRALGTATFEIGR